MGFESMGPGLPAGGTAGQVLTKASNANYDVTWGANVILTDQGTPQPLNEVVADLVKRVNALEEKLKNQ